MPVNVLIADDDYLIIEDLKRMVDWKALGFCIVTVAQNGEKALAAAKRLRPLLVITDVQMPGLDGLSFLEQLRGILPDTVVVIISSFDNFDYVKRALRGGADDYLLKNEITKETLSAKLSEIHQKLNRKSTREAALARTLLNDYVLSLRSLHEIAAEYSASDALYASVAAIVDRKMYWLVLTSRKPLKRVDFKGESARAEGSRLLKTFREEQDSFDVDAIYFYVYDCLVIGSNAFTRASDVRQTVEKLRASLEKRLGHTLLSVVVGEPVRLSSLRTTVAELEPVLQFRSVFPISTCMETPVLQREKYVQVKELFDYSLLPYVNEASSMKTKEALARYVRYLYDMCDIETMIRFYGHMTQKLEEMGARPSEEDRFFDTPEQVSEHLIDLYDETIRAETVMRDILSGSSTVARAASYIKAHYAESDLSIEQIAEAVGLSAGRLSVVFKKETGKTVVDYLTDERIRQALYLLRNTNLKIYEVALRTGFNSSQYFSKVFYKKTGKKPIEFK